MTNRFRSKNNNTLDCDDDGPFELTNNSSSQPLKQTSDCTAKTEMSSSSDNEQQDRPVRERRGSKDRDLVMKARMFDKNFTEKERSEKAYNTLKNGYVPPEPKDAMEPITFGNTQLPNTLHFVNATLTNERQQSLQQNIKKNKSIPLTESAVSKFNKNNRDNYTKQELEEKARKMKLGERRKLLLDENRRRNEIKLSIAAMKQLINNTFVRKKKNLKASTEPKLFQNFCAPKLEIDQATFKPPVNPKTEWQRNLIHKAIKNVFVLKGNKKKEELIDAMEEVLIPKDGVLYRQGDDSNQIEMNQFYVVEKGTILVQVDGITVDTVKAGTAFGQERLLMQGRNQATVKATEETKLFRLDQKTFRGIMQHGEETVEVAMAKAEAAPPAPVATKPPVAPKAKKSTKSASPKASPKMSSKKTSAKKSSSSSSTGSSSVSSTASSKQHDLDHHEKSSKKSTSTSSSPKSPKAQKTVKKKKKMKKITVIKKKMVTKKRRKEVSLEDSPVYLQQKALRESVQKHAPNKDDLEFIKVLGEGQYGEVWLVAATLPDQDPKKQEFALKLQSRCDDQREDASEEIKREIRALQELQHPFIANLVHVYESEDNIDMLMGLIKGGELWDTIHKQDPVTEEWTSGIPEYQAKFYAFLLADIFSFLYQREYVFRDLKPENVMLDHEGYPILVDFGFAKHVPTGAKTFTFCGTPNYVAPEVIKNAGHGAAVDHWALGVVIYEMISGENPFFYDDMEQFELYQSITEEDPYPMGDNVDPSTEVLDLLDELFVKEPEDRLGIDGVLKHAWFKGMPDLKKFRAKAVKPPKLVNGKVVYDEEPYEEPVTWEEYQEEVEYETEIEVTDSEGESEEEDSDMPLIPIPPGTKMSTDSNGIKKANFGTIVPEWRKKENLRGYYAKLKSPEEKQSSQARRGQVKGFLADILSEY